MNRVPLNFPPGLWKNGTKYQAKGRWYDAHLVRFLDGTIMPIGGWRRAQAADGSSLTAVSGRPSSAFAYRGADSAYRIGVGTSTHLFALKANVLTDITPVDLTSGVATASYSPGGATTGIGPLMATLTNADAWSLDNFGNYLVGVMPSDGRVLVWQDNASPAAPATGAPTGVLGVVATPEGYLMALGQAGDTRKVAWPSQRTFTDWTPTTTNTAGAFPLQTAGNLVCGRRTKSNTLLFTDSDLWIASYIGTPNIYGFTQAGQNCGIVAPNAVAMIDGQAVWWGHRKFFTYNGFVQPLECDVADFVFNNMNEAQRSKIWAMTNTQFGEVWFFYCSLASTEIDSYVVYNYIEHHWAVGSLTRLCGFDAGVTPLPMMIDSSGVIWEHETGSSRSGPAAPYLESGPMEIGSGDNVMKVQRIIPDDKTVGDVEAKVYTALEPDDAETLLGPYTLTSQTDVRITARQARLRLDEVNATNWRVGTIRLGGIIGGPR